MIVKVNITNGAIKAEQYKNTVSARIMSLKTVKNSLLSLLAFTAAPIIRGIRENIRLINKFKMTKT
jgi:hypothetical protein